MVMLTMVYHIKYEKWSPVKTEIKYVCYAFLWHWMANEKSPQMSLLWYSITKTFDIFCFSERNINKKCKTKIQFNMRYFQCFFDYDVGVIVWSVDIKLYINFIMRLPLTLKYTILLIIFVRMTFLIQMINDLIYRIF